MCGDNRIKGKSRTWVFFCRKWIWTNSNVYQWLYLNLLWPSWALCFVASDPTASSGCTTHGFFTPSRTLPYKQLRKCAWWPLQGRVAARWSCITNAADLLLCIRALSAFRTYFTRKLLTAFRFSLWEYIHRSVTLNHLVWQGKNINMNTIPKNVLVEFNRVKN